MSDDKRPEEVIESRKLIDGGNVIVLVGDEQRQIPIPLPDIFQQLFSILGDLDKRLMALEGQKGSIITLN